MPLTSILLHLDSTAAARARLSLAIGYAAKHGARLIAVYADGSDRPGAAEEAGGLFSGETARTGISAQWHAPECSGDGTGLVETLCLLAHLSDLVIVGQTPPDGGSPGVPVDLPERLILCSGRPVLTVPYAGDYTSFGERVLVGWKDGRGSTRSLHDALPILEKAQRVHILRVLISKDSGTPAELSGNLVSFLAGHGIKARPEDILAPDFPLGDLLLNHACEEGIDLLVMGAYDVSHGKPVLGKTARHILRHMTLPVLMSH